MSRSDEGIQRSTRGGSNRPIGSRPEAAPYRRLAGSDRVGTLLTGADPLNVVDQGDPDLAVADLAGVGCLGDDSGDALRLFGRHEHFDLDLGYEVDGVLRTAVGLGVATLAAEPLNLRNCHPGDACPLEGVVHGVKYEGLDDSRYEAKHSDLLSQPVVDGVRSGVTPGMPSVRWVSRP